MQLNRIAQSFTCFNRNTPRSKAWRDLTTSCMRRSLMQFFDDQKNWGEPSIRAGRPWRKDELRLKNNRDLHMLWYILLKERNMLMTMETEHHRCLERMPNSERFEKVEESMENLLGVVEERNKAEDELETGEWIGPTVTRKIDALGRQTEQLTRENNEPQTAVNLASDERMWSESTIELLRLEREKKANRRRQVRDKQMYKDRLDKIRKADHLSESSIESYST